MKKIILCLMLGLGLCGEAQAQKMKLEPGELTDQIKSDKGTRFAYQISKVPSVYLFQKNRQLDFQSWTPVPCRGGAGGRPNSPPL